MLVGVFRLVYFNITGRISAFSACIYLFILSSGSLIAIGRRLRMSLSESSEMGGKCCCIQLHFQRAFP